MRRFFLRRGRIRIASQLKWESTGIGQCPKTAIFHRGYRWGYPNEAELIDSIKSRHFRCDFESVPGSHKINRLRDLYRLYFGPCNQITTVRSRLAARNAESFVAMLDSVRCWNQWE
jgi:hypothetical protein